MFGIKGSRLSAGRGFTSKATGRQQQTAKPGLAKYTEYRQAGHSGLPLALRLSEVSRLAEVSLLARKFTTAPAHRAHRPEHLEDYWRPECVLGAARPVRVLQVLQAHERHK